MSESFRCLGDPAVILGSVFALFIALVVRLCVGAWSRWSGLQPIPKAPGSIPCLGHMVRLLRHPLPWEEMLAWTQGGSIVHWWLPGEDWLSVQGGEAMRTVFQTNFKDYYKETQMSFQPFLCILGTGLVTSQGKLWQSQRKLMTPAFKGEILHKVLEISLQAVDRLAAKLDEKSGDGACHEMDEEFRLLTLQVITEAIMSLHHKESDRVFPKLYLPIMEEAHRRVLARWRQFMFWTASWWRHRSNIAQLDDYLQTLVQKRWNALTGTEREENFRDLLDLILVAKKKEGVQLTVALQRQLRFELKTFLLAGHETSAAMLTLTLVELIRDGNLRARVLQEARAALGPSGSKVPSRSEVEGMVFTMACLQETLRKYTVVPLVTRIAVTETKLCGYKVPKGTKVALHLHGTHRKWDCPDAYRPDRFLPGGEFDQFPEEIRRFMFVPFGQGPRVCIGQHFSLIEARVVLAALLLKFEFALQRPYQMEWQSLIIPLQPRGGVPVTAQRMSADPRGLNGHANNAVA